MVVDKKIEEAERWLEKIKKSYPHNQLEIQDNVNAFLDAVNSIPDHLLHDYSEKYNLGILLTDKLYPDLFKKKATEQKNQIALDFLTRWIYEKKIIECTQIGSVLTQKRDHNMHRLTQSPNPHVTIAPRNLEIGLVSVVSTGMSEEQIKAKTNEEFKKLEEKNKNERSSNSTEIKNDFYFDGLSNINVIEACEQIHNLMKGMISTMRTTFP